MKNDMMTNTLTRALPAILVAGLLAANASAQSNASRVATIDLNKVSEKYYKWQEAKNALSRKETELQKDLDDQKKRIVAEQEEDRKLRADVEDPLITGDARRAREKAVTDKEEQIRNDADTYTELKTEDQQTLERFYQELTDRVLQDIQTAVNAKAKAAGYNLVINTSSTPSQPLPIVMYSDGQNDITDEIIRQLNAAAPPDTGAGSTNAAASKK